jgi:poly(A) polymerase
MGRYRRDYREPRAAAKMNSELPDADWRHANGLKQLVAALKDEHGGPRYVGGAVRDTLLGLEVADIDLATTLTPDEVIDRLDAARIRAIPTGLEHGTVTAVADSKNYEITTLRRDVATDGRRAVVAFSTDWREDAARRDFTINALYANPQTGEIFDYFEGLRDLDAGVIRFIGDADQRIAEDFLRILRYFRFLARYGHGPVDGKAIAACANGAHGMTALSRERIAQELVKILALHNPVGAVSLMVDNGIFAPFLPELAGNVVQKLTALTDREKIHPHAISLAARLLTLLPKDPVSVDRVAARLKLSNKMREALAIRVSSPQPSTDTIRALAYRSGVECARDAAMLYASDEEFGECLAKLDGWQTPKFDLKGGDLIGMGLIAGPLVARTLRTIEASWISEGFPSAERLAEIAAQSVADARSASKNA